jgi:hypothetical protein
MFGPDTCGHAISRIHLIFREGATDAAILKALLSRQAHARAGDRNLLHKHEIKLSYNEKDEYTHLYTLVGPTGSVALSGDVALALREQVLNTDNTYEVLLDQKLKARGELHDGWDFAKKFIEDPKAQRPANWVTQVRARGAEECKPHPEPNRRRRFPTRSTRSLPTGTASRSGSPTRPCVVPAEREPAFTFTRAGPAAGAKAVRVER